MKFIIFLGVLSSVLFLTIKSEMHLDLLKLVGSNETVLTEKNSRAGSTVSISCTCNGKTLKEDLPVDIFKTGHEDIDFFEYCEKNNTSVCELSRKCDNCTLEIKNCTRLSKTKSISSECIYRRIRIKEERHMLKTKINGPERHRRDLYLNYGCVFPNEMRTSELKCTIFIKYIKCKQICMYGYTLDEGISKQMECYYKDKRWSGNGFKECMPFVDCNMKLISGGQMSCETNTMYKAPHCNVSCEPYEDKPAIPMRTYTCTTEPHKWNPKLPHCVISGSGLQLVSAPRIKDPSNISFDSEPKFKKPQSNKVAKPDLDEADNSTE